MSTICPYCKSSNNFLYMESKISVASDGQFIHAPSKSYFCNDCLFLFKSHIKDGDACNIIEKTYERYTLHSINGAEETRVLYDLYSEGIKKSEYNYIKLNEFSDLADDGSILDVGCHYGSFLKIFNDKKPRWSLTGLDVSKRFSEEVYGISDSSRFILGNITQLSHEEKFDAINISHVLEHIADLESFWLAICSILKDEGFVFLQANNLVNNIFLPVIYEQFYNFTIESIAKMLNKYGLYIEKYDVDTLTKEFSCIIRKGQPLNETMPDDCLAKVMENKLIIDQINKNLSLKDRFEGFYILGASYISSWLVGNYKLKIKNYVDDNLDLCGKAFNSLEVIPTTEMCRGEQVIIPFPPCMSKKISARFSEALGVCSITIPFDEVSSC